MSSQTIVVGAGAAGLVAALYLQRASRQVLLLEAKSRVGGCASSFPITLRNGPGTFRFLAGATTLIGLEPGMPLGEVLRELDVKFDAPVTAQNLTLHQGDDPLTLTRDATANHRALTAKYGVDFANFWQRSAALGARGWELITRVHFPPRTPMDLIRAGGVKEAWQLLPSLLSTTRGKLDELADVPDAARELLDEVLLVSTQATAAETPYLFGALGLEYLQRPLYWARGGLASLLEHLAQVFVARGGTLQLETPVSAFSRKGAGFRVETSRGAFDGEQLVLNLTHWDAHRLARGELASTFSGAVKRHPDAWATCTLYLGVEDVFGDVAPYHQVLLPEPLPITRAHSIFVTIGPGSADSMAPPGFRAVTMSCHVKAREWEGLDDAQHAERKTKVGEELLGAVARAFPKVRDAAKPVVMPGTPRTWEGFTGRRGGRVGGLPFDLATLARGFPTGRTRVPGLVRLGDTVFPGQSVPACAWGARRVVGELLQRSQ